MWLLWAAFLTDRQARLKRSNVVHTADTDSEQFVNEKSRVESQVWTFSIQNKRISQTEVHLALANVSDFEVNFFFSEGLEQQKERKSKIDSTIIGADSMLTATNEPLAVTDLKTGKLH